MASRLDERQRRGAFNGYFRHSRLEAPPHGQGSPILLAPDGWACADLRDRLADNFRNELAAVVGSIDMNLPALVLIAADFFAAPERAALTMSAFMAGFSISALALGAILLPSTPSVWLLVLGLSVNSLSFGFVVPNTSQAALESITQIGGTGGAALGFVQMAGGSRSSALVGRLYTAIGAAAMPSTMLLFASGSLVIFLFVVAMRERRHVE